MIQTSRRAFKETERQVAHVRERRLGLNVANRRDSILFLLLADSTFEE